MNRAGIHTMDIRGGVVEVERARNRNMLCAEYRPGQFLTQLTVRAGREEIRPGINIDHWHE